MEQYRDASNLRARADLHARFSTNPYGWFRWVFDHLATADRARILEVGCGPGGLWQVNADRIPPTWRITLSDLSPGMVGEARRTLRRHPVECRFLVGDAQALPLPTAAMDAVIANHMLYHVRDRARALREFHRVLRPGGHLYVGTNGRAHMRELGSLWQEATGAPLWGDAGGADFTLENGGAILGPWFRAIVVDRYLDGLAVTEVAPLLAYVRSGAHGGEASASALERFASAAAGEIGRAGAFRITKDAGLFYAVRRDGVDEGPDA